MTRTRQLTVGIVVLAAVVGLFFLGQELRPSSSLAKLIQTINGVVIAIGGSAVLFIGANLFFDLAPTRWRIFNAGVGGAVGLFGFGILWANDLMEVGAVAWIAAILIGAGAGYLLGGLDDVGRRVPVAVAAGLAMGLLLGGFLERPLRPSIDQVAVVAWLAIGLAAGGLVWLVRGRRKPIRRVAAFWAAVGWFMGASLASQGGGGVVEAVIVYGVLGGLLGLWVGLSSNGDQRSRETISEKSRAAIFLTPALLFIGATLVVPTLRTLWLSFLGPFAKEAVGLQNYWKIFTDQNVFKVTDWPEIFTSRLFQFGLALAVIGIVAGIVLGRRTGHRFESSGASLGPLTLGVFLVAFALFTVLRGTIFNNLWWVFTVTILATSIGLALAVLADRSRAESVAKSIIFMPMAVSFVGASIIWRAVYNPKQIPEPQTGVLNALWVGLGRVSNSGVGKVIAISLVAVVMLAVLYFAYRALSARMTGVAVGAAMLTLPLAWVIYRFLGPGLGGFRTNPAGDVVGETIVFLNEAPLNNFWLMVVLIWIQTGFTMVIFSAAIKAVPQELIEASKVDGATESQTFWRVTVPQIAPTIGVVVTTLIVLVMKVFDIVKVMTNGNFGTQVLANEMWQRAFTELNFGLGSALAVVLFLSVLPVMYINIRRMQKAET